MKALYTVAPGQVELRDVPVPEVGPGDALIRIRACGICGTDLMFFAAGGLPIDGGIPIRLGHEPAGEVAEVGAAVTAVSVGDRVVLNPMTSSEGILGNGGPQGGLSDYVLIRDVQAGRDIEFIPDGVPFDIAALNEPMAVARHIVNQARPSASHTVAVFGAGPIGLGVTIWLTRLGVRHIAVIDIVSSRLETALTIGGDAVINAADEDVAERLRELHGTGLNGVGMPRAGTDIYIDASGATAALTTAIENAKSGARLVMAGSHKQPELVDTSQIVMSELTWIGSMGYPTEIFEVTPSLADGQEKFARLISHRIDIDDVEHAFQLATTPGAAEKIVVTFPG